MVPEACRSDLAQGEIAEGTGWDSGLEQMNRAGVTWDSRVGLGDQVRGQALSWCLWKGSAGCACLLGSQYTT